MISKINNLLGFRSGSSAMRYVALLSLLTFMVFNVQTAQAERTVEVVTGNPECDCGEYEFKIEPVENGTYTDPDTGVEFIISGTRPYFNFEIDGGTACAVIAKGGPNANVYYYDPPVSSDTGLSAPINPATGRPYGLSHVTFCYTPGITRIEANKICTGEQTTTLVDGELKILSSHNLYVENTGNFDVDLFVKETAANLECKLVAIGAAPADIYLPSDPPEYVDIEYNLPAGESVNLTIACIADALNVANSADVLAISEFDEFEDKGNLSDMNDCPFSPDLAFEVKKECDYNRMQQVELDGNLALVVEVCPEITVENTSPDFQTLENVTVYDDLIPALQGGANIGDIEPGQTANVAQRLFDAGFIDFNNLCYQPSTSQSALIDTDEGIKYDTVGAAFFNEVTVTAEGELEGDISTDFPVSVTCPLCP
jgi:hypothetical protein